MSKVVVFLLLFGCSRTELDVPASFWLTDSGTRDGDDGAGSEVQVSTNLGLVAAGQESSCAITTDGTVKCWGGSPLYGPVDIAPVVVGAKFVATGPYTSHTCAITQAGDAKCWGENFAGDLGDGTQQDSTTAVDVKGLGKVKVIDAGYAHSCAVTIDGSVYCWGFNHAGQLGDGTTNDSMVPVSTGITTATWVSTSSTYSCAALEDGTARCWGLGPLDSQTPVSTPVTVPGLSNVKTITTGTDYACAVLQDGSLACWGLNNAGQLGNGKTVDSPTPVVAAISDVAAVCCANTHTCVLQTSGDVRCVGTNGHGQLGDGTNTNRLSFVLATHGAVSIACGGPSPPDHTCARMADGSTRCWGSNDEGQLGDGTHVDRNVPTAVVGF